MKEAETRRINATIVHFSECEPKRPVKLKIKNVVNKAAM
jgi:hypothetical protein